MVTEIINNMRRPDMPPSVPIAFDGCVHDKLSVVGSETIDDETLCVHFRCTDCATTFIVKWPLWNSALLAVDWSGLK